MVRKHIIPETNSVMVTIPENYIGKKVEVLVFADEDMQESQPVKPDISKYKGTLSKERAVEFRQFAEEIRKEWDRNI